MRHPPGVAAIVAPSPLGTGAASAFGFLLGAIETKCYTQRAVSASNSLPPGEETALPHPLVRTPEEWKVALARLGERPFRALPIFQWIHRRGVTDARAMTDLPVGLRDRLVDEGLRPVLDVPTVRRSLDDTRKLLARFGDGATVETVLIPAVSGPGSAADRARVAEPDADALAAGEGAGEGDADAAVADVDDDDLAPGVRRVTQCISTQVGCAMGCVFCASGVAGLKRHLAPEEVVGQVLEGRAHLDPGEELRNVVLMGMGEPLHNYDATARALRLLGHPLGINLSSRRVTVSTSGLVPEIDRLGRDFGGQVTLAISLHATTDERRTALMPINKKYPLAELLAALRRYPLPKRRRFTIEFTLVAGQNDDAAEAKRLAALLRGLPVKVNLIPMNPIQASTLAPPDRSAVFAFQKILLDAGYACFIRRTRGDDVDAACGQLALLGGKPRPRRPFANEG
jgi:23S rRNA (adenine2503-C2)-methyltransferase